MKIFLIVYIYFLFFSNSFAIEKLENAHASSMHGIPKYSADFKHFDYVILMLQKVDQLNFIKLEALIL